MVVLSACNQSVRVTDDAALLDPSEILLLSETGERLSLQAKTVSGVVVIQLPERGDVLEAAYYVDDLPTSDEAEPLSQASAAPFTLTLDTTLLEDGSHTAVIEVTYRGSSRTTTQQVKVGFKVRNGNKSANKAPKVRAGPDLTASVDTDLKILGSVSDDGRPNGYLNVRWTMASGPAEATFRSPDDAETLVSFPVPGTYVLRITADDGHKASNDTVEVSVTGPTAKNAAPTADAGRDLLVTLPNRGNLAGSASDDGLPSGRLDLMWSVISGPGSVTFDDATLGTTTGEFSEVGTYVLMLTADDGDLSSTDTLTVVVEPEPVEPETPTDPTPPDPEPTPTDPAPPVGGKLDLIGDPSFRASSLPSETQVWYGRFLSALHSSDPYPNVMGAASSGDLYSIGRTVNTNVTTTLNVFRLTGDLQLLDHVDKVMQAARAELRDTNGDGFLNWRWLRDKQETAWYGDDLHVMDEIMSHGLVAQVAWVYRQNQALPSPSGVDYEERADFWADYLQDWEAKWRARSRKATGFPFISKHLTHPHLNLLRFHWYSYRLTEDEGYLREANRLADEMNSGQFKSISTTNGTGYVFPHGVLKYSSHDYLAPLNYAGYSTQVLMDLAFEPFEAFSPEATLVPLANTIATKVIDNGSTDFAPSIGGSKPIAGYDLRSTSRTTTAQWAIYPIGEYAAFDKSGTISATNQKIYYNIERDSDRPSRITIPAAMIIDGLLIG